MEGWHSWIRIGGAFTPYAYERVLIMRPDWKEPQTVKPAELDPLTNVFGLYWKPFTVKAIDS